VREQERIQIARELHDELSSILTVLKLGVVRISDQLLLRDSGEFSEIIEKTQSMEEMINKSVTLVRKMITRLRPAILDDLGLIAAIEWLVEEYQQDSGLRCNLLSEVEELDIESSQATAVFRILQEILTNVARHAKASEVNISLKMVAGKFVLRVRDNGRGIRPADISKKKSFGIMGMRERASLFHWEFVIEGEEGKGTEVTLTLPVGGRSDG
jgi:signal transduction histidine kinase